MTIKFLGSGGAFVNCKENYNSNILISKNGKNLLYDAGSDIKHSMAMYNLNISDIDSIFISHLHSDHCGGIEYFGFKSLFSKENKKIKLISSKEVLTDGWNNCWSGTMKFTNKGIMTLENYFTTKYLNKMSFNFNNISFKMVKNLHIASSNYNLPSYGIKFKNKKQVYISGDTQFNFKRINNLINYDYIFHECSFEGNTKVHTSFEQLNKLDKKIKSKIWIYHYSLNGKKFKILNKIVLKAGFMGLVKRGDEFEC